MSRLNKLNRFLFALSVGLLYLLGCAVVAKADNTPCDHPIFQEVGCVYETDQGPPGPIGPQGEPGPAGPTGPIGPAGEVDYNKVRQLINDTYYSRFNAYGKTIAATESIQIHLPQEQDHRVTFGVSSFNSNTGLGIGYAHVLDSDNTTAITVGLGTSGGDWVGKASVGFEFGGSKNRPIYAPLFECSYVGGTLEGSAKCVKDK